MGTTNNKRIILRKYGEPISKSSKSNYPLWKLATNLSLSELSMLMTKRKHDLKFEILPDIISNLREEILLLNDAYIIRKRENLELSYKENIIDIDSYIDLEPLDILVSDIITRLDYSQNTIFKQEGIAIAKKIDLEDIPREILATCIVKDILDKYNSKYDNDYLLKIFQIPEELFYKYFVEVSRWCLHHYWRR